jgi:putative hemolysin
VTRLAIVLATTLIVALLTAGATAVRSVNRLWLRSWIERDDDTNDEPVQRFVDRPKRLLMASGTGVALTVFLAGAALTRLDRGDPWQLAQDGALLAALVLVFGQLLPRAIARRWAAQLVPVFVPLLRVLAVAVAPLRLVAKQAASAVARRIAPRTTAAQAAADQNATEGLSELLQDGSLDGLDAREELAIISGVVQLTGKTAGEVMTPRRDLFALDEALPADELARQIAHAGFSRVPVYRGSIDEPVGMLHAFDVFVEAGGARPALRPISEAPASQPAGELLYALLRARRQLAIVRAADGTVAGLVTLEDLLEELVGEIADEHDEPATGSRGDA